MYEKLKKFLEEWKTYTSMENETELPERILRNECWSIARAVDYTLAEMRGTEEFEKISDNDKEIIDQIYDYLIIASKK